MMGFHYDRSTINTQSELNVLLADLRDLVQAFNIPNESQRRQELLVVLESIVKKNKLPPRSLWVE